MHLNNLKTVRLSREIILSKIAYIAYLEAIDLKKVRTPAFENVLAIYLRTKKDGIDVKYIKTKLLLSLLREIVHDILRTLKSSKANKE